MPSTMWVVHLRVDTPFVLSTHCGSSGQPCGSSGAGAIPGSDLAHKGQGRRVGASGAVTWFFRCGSNPGKQPSSLRGPNAGMSWRRLLLSLYLVVPAEIMYPFVYIGYYARLSLFIYFLGVLLYLQTH